MNRNQKKELVEELHKVFNRSNSIVVTHINGLTVQESTSLRSDLRKSNCKFRVTKNKIVKLALRKLNLNILENYFKDQRQWVFLMTHSLLQKY